MNNTHNLYQLRRVCLGYNFARRSVDHVLHAWFNMQNRSPVRTIIRAFPQFGNSCMRDSFLRSRLLKFKAYGGYMHD